MGGDAPWTCGCCGSPLDAFPLDVAFGAPDAYHALTMAERSARGWITSDFCEMDGVGYVRTCLDVPVRGTGRSFTWGLWVRLDRAALGRAVELFDVDAAADEPTQAGHLANALPRYPDTAGLPCRVRFGSSSRRPMVTVAPGDHPLGRDQRDGIRAEDVHGILRPFMGR